MASLSTEKNVSLEFTKLISRDTDSTVYARRTRDGSKIKRDSIKFKIANILKKHHNEEKDPVMEQQERQEVLLRKSKKPMERLNNNSADQVTGPQEEYQDDNNSTGTREEIDVGDIAPTLNDNVRHED